MLEKTLLEFAALVGFAAIVALLVNVLKLIKIKGKPIVADGDAQKWTGGLNLLGLLALYVFRIFRPEVPIAGLDATLLEIASVGALVLSYVGQLGVSRITNFVVKGMPLIGTSYSLNEEKAQAKFGR
jgi:hypothetical protein